MKRIAFVSSLSNRGGTEITLIQLLKTIPEKKYDITLLLLGRPGELAKQVPDWIRIRPVCSEDCKSLLKNTLLHGDVFSTIRIFWSILCRMVYRRMFASKKFTQYSMLVKQYEKKVGEYDIAIAWALPSSIENVYALENVKAKRKAMWVHMDITKDKPPIDARAFYANYDDIFCVSMACKNKFDEVFPECREKTKVFYNMIDKVQIREKVNFPILLDENVFKIMTCGRLSSEKQPLMAIEIVKRLLGSGMSNFKWYFVGGGGNRESELRESICREHLESYIVLLGFQENPYSYVSKADLYVQMSRHESFCLTLAEAQILGIPAVTTNFPSAYEIVDDGRTGYIVKNDVNEMTIAIETMMSDRNKLEEMRTELKQTCIVPVGDPSQFIRYVDDEE